MSIKDDQPMDGRRENKAGLLPARGGGEREDKTDETGEGQEERSWENTSDTQRARPILKSKYLMAFSREVARLA